MDTELGQVRAGFLAICSSSTGDPTADVTILQDKRNLRAIMKDGRLPQVARTGALTRCALARTARA
jgi:hypothetical protein